jgi:hypothetical protein
VKLEGLIILNFSVTAGRSVMVKGGLKVVELRMEAFIEVRRVYNIFLSGLMIVNYRISICHGKGRES